MSALSIQDLLIQAENERENSNVNFVEMKYCFGSSVSTVVWLTLLIQGASFLSKTTAGWESYGVDLKFRFTDRSLENRGSLRGLGSSRQQRGTTIRVIELTRIQVLANALFRCWLSHATRKMLARMEQ